MFREVLPVPGISMTIPGFLMDCTPSRMNRIASMQEIRMKNTMIWKIRTRQAGQKHRQKEACKTTWVPMAVRVLHLLPCPTAQDMWNIRRPEISGFIQILQLNRLPLNFRTFYLKEHNYNLLTRPEKLL